MKECFDKVRLSSHHLLNLVNDVLDMSKSKAVKSTCAAPAVRPACRRGNARSIKPQADSAHLTFSVLRVDVEEGLVLGDEMREPGAHQPAGSAVRSTEPSGTVSLAVEELRGDERVVMPPSTVFR